MNKREIRELADSLEPGDLGLLVLKIGGRSAKNEKEVEDAVFLYMPRAFKLITMAAKGLKHYGLEMKPGRFALMVIEFVEKPQEMGACELFISFEAAIPDTVRLLRTCERLLGERVRRSAEFGDE